jgi:hypothetical protein
LVILLNILVIQPRYLVIIGENQINSKGNVRVVCVLIKKTVRKEVHGEAAKTKD